MGISKKEQKHRLILIDIALRASDLWDEEDWHNLKECLSSKNYRNRLIKRLVPKQKTKFDLNDASEYVDSYLDTFVLNKINSIISHGLNAYKPSKNKRPEEKYVADKRLLTYVYDDLKHFVLDIAANQNGSEWTEVMKHQIIEWLYTNKNQRLLRLNIRKIIDMNMSPSDADVYIQEFHSRRRDNVFARYDPDKATHRNCIGILNWVKWRLGLFCTEGRERCDLRVESARNDNEQQTITEAFRSEFKSKKKACAVLIICSTYAADKLTIAGFNDMRHYTTRLVDDSPDSVFLLEELKSELEMEPRNKGKIVDLVISRLGLTRWGTGQKYQHWKHEYYEKKVDDLPDDRGKYSQDKERTTDDKLDYFAIEYCNKTTSSNDLQIPEELILDEEEQIKKELFDQASMALNPQQKEVYQALFIDKLNISVVSSRLNKPNNKHVSIVLSQGKQRFRIGLILAYWDQGLQHNDIYDHLLKTCDKKMNSDMLKEFIREVIYDSKYDKYKQKVCPNKFKLWLILVYWASGIQPNDIAKKLNLTSNEGRSLIEKVIFDPEYENDRQHLILEIQRKDNEDTND